jgi:cellulose synthase/poly-beta-1,6-N-acetylglucosamine synthase-like glycosyltransferase
MSTLSVVLIAVTVPLIAYSLFSLYLVVYAWNREETLACLSPPGDAAEPGLSFTVLLAARHEQSVIQQTITRIAAAHYPPELLEVIVICHEDDAATIAEARRTASAVNARSATPDRVRVVTFSGGPVTKPRALNVGLREARHDVVTIFDAEDDVSLDVFRVVNTTILREGAAIVQVGVQLMNYEDHWFSMHNVLEYFYHFKSRLLYFAHKRMVPLGGNTVFIRRPLLERAGGWDEKCLTEDADLGVRLSVLGEGTRIVYDPRYVTREETPDSTESLVRQRTRWHQGFLQVLVKRDWVKLPTFGRRALGLYVFTGPLVQGVLTVAAPLAVVAGLWLKTHPAVVLIAYLPIYPILFHLLLTLAGARLFAVDYGIRLRPRDYLWLCVTFLPYHVLIGLSAVRAMGRQLLGVRNWEKTAHVGAHRAVGALAEAPPQSPPDGVDATAAGEEAELVR